MFAKVIHCIVCPTSKARSHHRNVIFNSLKGGVCTFNVEYSGWSALLQNDVHVVRVQLELSAGGVPLSAKLIVWLLNDNSNQTEKKWNNKLSSFGRISITKDFCSKKFHDDFCRPSADVKINRQVDFAKWRTRYEQFFRNLIIFVLQATIVSHAECDDRCVSSVTRSNVRQMHISIFILHTFPNFPSHRIWLWQCLMKLITFHVHFHHVN